MDPPSPSAQDSVGSKFYKTLDMCGSHLHTWKHGCLMVFEGVFTGHSFLSCSSISERDVLSPVGTVCRDNVLPGCWEPALLLPVCCSELGSL